TSEVSGTAKPLGKRRGLTKYPRPALPGAVLGDPLEVFTCGLVLPARSRLAPWRIGASGLRLQRAARQHRNRSTKRKKIARYGFHANNRYTNRRPVRTT